jgi:small subunit ribosomal protein S4e
MARGPKKHLKRLMAPKSWMLSKMAGAWAPRPSTGPHKLRESLPLTVALRNRLKYALTRREVMMIVMRRLIAVDGKIRTDLNYPAGFMDVISMEKTDEQFRLLYDVKGRYVLHAVKADEGAYKLCRVTNTSKANKATMGRNPFATGQAAVVPYLTTHDGRTIRYPDPLIKKNDTIKFDIKTGKITGHLKFDLGNLAMVTKGANVGRVGSIVHKDKHPGSFDIVHLKDKKGNTFATRASNVFIIGEGQKAWISLPKAQGVKLSVLEERAERAEKTRKDAEKVKRAAKKAASKDK